uniref:VWFA domain-containing protein n=1 Tax=Syphacia muris TaxID=451379 RepID=A0A158R5V3_9BILA
MFSATTNGTRGKKCQPEKVELDVAMVLDASSGVDRYGYAGEKAAVISLFSSLTISQQFSFTHVATVYMGQKTAYNSSNLGTYRGSDSAKNDIRHLPYLGGDLNILRGLTKAHSVVNGYGARKSVPKVIVLFSSVPIDCEKHQPGTQAVSCEKLKELKSKGITVISVDLRYHENPTKRAMSFGDYSLQNDESLVSDIQSIFCDVSPVKDMELKPYRCPCILHGLWLNIIVSFDSSDGAGTMALAAQKAAITALLHRIFVNQRKGQFSKIAFLNTGSETQIVSNLTRYNFATEAVEEIRKIQLIGGAINLQEYALLLS